MCTGHRYTTGQAQGHKGTRAKSGPGEGGESLGGRAAHWHGSTGGRNRGAHTPKKAWEELGISPMPTCWSSCCCWLLAAEALQALTENRKVASGPDSLKLMKPRRSS